MSLNARSVIAHLGSSFIADNCTVLVHGTSRVVNGLVLKAAESKQFNIIVTESRPGTFLAHCTQQPAEQNFSYPSRQLWAAHC